MIIFRMIFKEIRFKGKIFHIVIEKVDFRIKEQDICIYYQILTILIETSNALGNREIYGSKI